MKTANNPQIESLFANPSPPSEERSSIEDLAARLLDELKATGRYRGDGAVLIVPPGAHVSVTCIVRTGREGEAMERRRMARAEATLGRT